MVQQQSGTLFVGSDPDSDEAIEVLTIVGMGPHIVNVGLTRRDFNIPFLINAWGVFEGVQEIRWFTELASERTLASGRAVLD